MTGPEHYQEAEVLLDKAAAAISTASPSDPATEAVAYADHLTAAAQVHATLAVVAAAAESTQSQTFTCSPRWRAVVTGEEYSG